MKKIKTIIIGLGKSGFGNIKGYMFYKSHSYTIFKLRNFELVAAVDKKKSSRIKFKKKYKLETCKYVHQIKQKVDLVVIAPNTKNHYKCIKDTLKYIKPKYIICEKPLTENFYLGKKITILCKNNNVSLFVNYVRRCLPSILKLKKIFNKNKDKYYLNILYPKGILNNGSHFIDLCIFLFGNIREIQRNRIIKKYKLAKDFDSVFKVKFKNAIANFSPHPNQDNSKISIVSKKKSVIWKKGQKIQVIFNNISKNKKFIETGMKSYQYYVMNEFLKKIKNQKSSICTSSEALKVLEIIEKLKKKYDKI